MSALRSMAAVRTARVSFAAVRSEATRVMIRNSGFATAQTARSTRSFFTAVRSGQTGGARWTISRLPFSVAGSRSMSSLPSHVALTMPALSPTMTAGTISKWMVKVGQKVTPGDHICDIETDKATIAWEAQEEGYIAKMLVEDGASDVPVGKTVLIVCDDGADVAAFANYVATGTPAAAAPPAPKPAAAAAPAATPAAAAPSKPAASSPPPPKSPGAGFVAAYKAKTWAFSSQYGLSTPQNRGS